jgi:predicted DNA-binding ribbon-helix-helix protein
MHFWKGLRESAAVRRMSWSKLIASIDAERRHSNLSSAIRLFVLDFYYQLIPLRKRPVARNDRQDWIRLWRRLTLSFGHVA